MVPPWTCHGTIERFGTPRNIARRPPQPPVYPPRSINTSNPEDAVNVKTQPGGAGNPNREIRNKYRWKEPADEHIAGKRQTRAGGINHRLTQMNTDKSQEDQEAQSSESVLPYLVHLSFLSASRTSPQMPLCSAPRFPAFAVNLPSPTIILSSPKIFCSVLGFCGALLVK